MLFLSYCGEDARAAAALAEGLRGQGLDVFCAAAARSAIPTGAAWTNILEAKLAACSGLAVLVGEAPLDGWVELEVAYVLERRARGHLGSAARLGRRRRGTPSRFRDAREARSSPASQAVRSRPAVPPKMDAENSTFVSSTTLIGCGVHPASTCAGPLASCPPS